jgi:isoleucyl-tRNA synthetase
MRKAAGYEISDRISAAIGGDPGTVERLRPFREWLADEVLAVDLALGPEAALEGADRSETAALDGSRLELSVRRG